MKDKIYFLKASRQKDEIIHEGKLINVNRAFQKQHIRQGNEAAFSGNPEKKGVNQGFHIQ